MVGLPGSGKTTYAERLRERETPQALLLSSDDIRWTMQMVSDGSYRPTAEKYVLEVIEGFTRGCMMYGRDVIVDATNLTRSRRAELVYWGKEFGGRVECHYIEVPAKESARRSARWISQEQIDKMAARFEEPSPDEGFDKLVRINGLRHA